MSLSITIGAMMSGKSTELIRIYNRLIAIGRKVLVINHSLDTRTDNSCKTHDDFKVPAIKLDKLSDLFLTNVCDNYNFILIEEAQFFSDLEEVVTKLVNVLNKNVHIFGLNADSEMKPFGQILQLIAKADNVQLLKSLCCVCKDGTDGVFTRCRVKKGETILIGGANMYESVCRKHYLENQN